MRALERYLLLQIIDNRWREHLYDMDYLREGIHLRGFAQIEPIVAYKNEAFDLFTDLMNSIWSDFARMVYHVEVEIEVDDPAAAQTAFGAPAGSRPAPGPSPTPAAAARCRAPTRSPRRPPAAAPSSSPRTRTAKRKSCSCPSSSSGSSPRTSRSGGTIPAGVGSGKKYKKCHGA